MTTSTPVGIKFREVMSGGFSLGETDPKAGEEKGDRSRQRLSMHGAITIEDLDRFIADPEHTGRLEGSIDYAPLGASLPATTGVFNLFAPGGDAKTKLMVYELGFSSGARAYYLAGQKRVRDDRGFDFWRDVTTLYTTLHEGQDQSAPVVGAGILSLGLNQLLKLAGGFEVTGTSSAAEKSKAIARFGGFFFGESWGSYFGARVGSRR